MVALAAPVEKPGEQGATQTVLIQSVYIIFYFILFRILVIIYAFNNLFLHCILHRHTYIIYIYIYTVYILYTIIHIYFMIF